MYQLLEFNPCINPAFAARMSSQREPVLAKLPLAPVNASPVPGLTSLYHDSDAGDYGDRSYPGNCSGNLIKDLLLFFAPELVTDPMSGSGTCSDVCKELGIPCLSFDIHDGFDACDPAEFSAVDTFSFIWSHPPYWRQKLYLDSPLDLSRSPTLEHFLRRYGQFIRNAARALKPGGKLAVLMGDYSDRDAGYVPLCFHTKRFAFECGLKQCCTDIIRFSHGASSSRKVYRSSFIPGLHDTCMVFERPVHTQKGGRV